MNTVRIYFRRLGCSQISRLVKVTKSQQAGISLGPAEWPRNTGFGVTWEASQDESQPVLAESSLRTTGFPDHVTQQSRGARQAPPSIKRRQREASAFQPTSVLQGGGKPS
jgi:hypothetical protein